MYRIVIRPISQKFLRKLKEPERSRVASSILELEQNPRPRGTDKVRGTELSRIRKGDYRIIFDIDDKNKIVTVVRIGHRREIYRDI